LQKYHDENIGISHRPAPHSFPEKKKLCEKAENAFLKTYCSPISDMTTAGFPQVSCNLQPCYFLESWCYNLEVIPRPPVVTTENAV
jgi:hypothetical protein